MDTNPTSTPLIHQATQRPLRVTVKPSRDGAIRDFVEHDPGTPQCRMSLYRSRKRQTWQVGLAAALDQAVQDFGAEMHRVFYPLPSGVLVNLSDTSIVGPLHLVKRLIHAVPDLSNPTFPVAGYLGVSLEPDQVHDGWGLWLLDQDRVLVIGPRNGEPTPM